MKGILLAGGTGTRLHPVTHSVSKQLLPIYDKPMIYYPLTTLILAGVSEVVVVTRPQDRSAFAGLLGDGSQFGISIEYADQDSPEGIPHALIVAEVKAGGGDCALILGDNMFHGPGLATHLASLSAPSGCDVFGYWVADPTPFGVVEVDASGRVVSIEEKPESPSSNWAVPGLYFFDDTAFERAKSLRPSSRGELEITDLLRSYHDDGRLNVNLLPRGTAWLDTGTFGALSNAGNYVRALEERQGLKIGCPEEAAWRRGYLSDADLQTRADGLMASGYGNYLCALLKSGPSA